MRYLRLLVFFVCTFLTFTQIIAQGPNDSGTYYQTADGKKGAELKTALCGVIYNRNEGGDLNTAYKALWTHFRTTDAKPNGKVWDMYSNKVEFEFGTNQDTGSGNQEGLYYNREHSMPNSWFGGKVMPMYTDLHHMYPTDKIVNNKRSNFPFGETANPSWKSANDFSKLGPCTFEGYTGTVFEPNDAYKGDFARTYFYMVTCYEEQIPTWYTSFLESQPTLDGNKYPGLSEWQLKMLMKWAKNDPVSEKEINRNNAVYGIQNNRNPFIDYPGLEEYIWGDKKDVAFSYDNYGNTNNTTYTFILSIKATGNGSASYNETTIRSQTSTFTVNKGTSATVTFAPDEGYRVANVKLDDTDITLSIVNNSYTINSISANTTLEVKFEVIPPSIDITKYISVYSAGGSISRTNDLINSGSQLNWRFSNNSDFSVTLKSLQLIDGATNQEGNIMSVNRTVDGGSSVTYSTTIGALGIHTPVTCRFRYDFYGNEYSADAVYPITYTLTIKSTGGGYAKYLGTTIRDESKSFSIEEFSSPNIYFTPDDGYRIKSLLVDGKTATSSISLNRYSINLVTGNKTIEVEFEAIPPTYTFNITSSGNGSVSYNNTSIRNNTKSYSLDSGASATVTITPDAGNKVKSIKLNNLDITSDVTDNQYTISNINSDNTLEVEFEAITHILSIKAIGNGSATYNSTAVRGKTESFTINEGTSAVVTFTPDAGYKIASVKVNGAVITSSVVNNSYTISNISANTMLEVEFDAIPSSGKFEVDGIYYNILSISEVEVTSKELGNYSGDIVIPEKVFYSGIDYSVTAIGNRALAQCSELTSVVLPSSVKTIGNYAFYYSQKLSSINIPSMVISIGKSAFQYTNLNSVTIPSSVISIGDEAFMYSKITSVLIPSSVKLIGENPFAGCYLLTSIKVADDNIIYDSRDGCNAIIETSTNTLITGCIQTVIPNSVTSIGNYAFHLCGLTSISIPESIRTIGNSAFSENSMSSITIPASVMNIGHNAFLGCETLEEIHVAEDNQVYNSRNNCNAIIETATSTLILGCKNTIIPTSVTTIGDYAFAYCLMTTIAIPESILSIGRSAFGESSLTNITLPALIKEIGISAFSQCRQLTTVISEIETPFKIDELVFNNISTEAILQVPKGTKSKYEEFSGWTKNFKTIVETTPQIQYLLNITASGNGSATYNSIAMRNKTQTFTVNEGSSATITFAPDAGYRIASVKLDDTDVTSSVVNNEYTISNITANTTLAVTFEAIPPTTYTFSITVSGNGTATFNSTAVRGKTQTFTVNEGTTAMVTFTPDAGHRIASVKLNNTDVTASVANSQYTLSNITANTTLTVTFEEIPPTTYALTISAVGSGSVTYDGNTVKGKTSSFTVVEGTNAVVTFSADDGNRLKSVKLGNTDVTSSVVNNQYTISNIKANTSLEVTFEAIPTYSLNITASGNGNATYNGTAVRGKTQTFTVNEGTSATVTFAPDAGYQIASVKLNGTDVTSSVANGRYTISNIKSDNTLKVEFEAIPPSTYMLNIVAVGNGSVSYNNTTIRNQSKEFTVVEESNVTITISPDNGYRLASVIVNDVDVTANVSNNHYTISNISEATNIEVKFEAITHIMDIIAKGNGTAIYSGTTIRDNNDSFTITEGSSASIRFTPDAGHKIKSVLLNDVNVTSDVINNVYTISNITRNNILEVEFEAIMHTLTIKATGNGSVSYNDVSISNQSKSFKLKEGASTVISITPDEGYRIQSVMLNNTDMTSQVEDGLFFISNIVQDNNVEVTFEAIPPTTYSLTITATGNGAVTYDGQSVRGGSSTFTVVEGSYATVQIVADDGYRLKRVLLDSKNVTADVADGQYTTTKIMANTTLVVEFEEAFTELAYNGVNYKAVSYEEQKVNVVSGNYGLTLTVPATFEADGKTWTVAGIDNGALANATELAAIIWDPEVAFTAQVSNPNLLLYVKKAEYAPSTIQNVVVGNQAESIVLKEAAEGNNFYCPREFTAKRISYEHNYSMISGYKTCQGWETIVLPFDVTMITNAKGTELVPYVAWQDGNSQRPFWLYQLTESGWQASNALKANVPYIISMPNNELYHSSYNQSGYIEFVGSNIQVATSDQVTTGQHGNKRLVANYQVQEASSSILALNVSNEWCQNTATEKEGSTFIRSLRSVHPFEAYMTVEGSNAPWGIPIFDNDVPTDIVEMERMRNGENEEWYDLQGRKLQGEPKKNGIYLHNGKKVRK